MSFHEEGHLGGYVIGGDHATRYEHLWSNLVEVLGMKVVLDVGCGEGHALDYFRSVGAIAYGVEGVQQESPFIIRHDFTEGRWTPPSKPDLVWCCEFVEHVAEIFVPNFLPALTSGNVLLMTHAEPGQQGYHHVNCRSADYWRGAMAARGFLYDERLTALTRAWAGGNETVWNHYCRSGMAFVRLGYHVVGLDELA